jgi:SM-20-related protein
MLGSTPQDGVASSARKAMRIAVHGSAHAAVVELLQAFQPRIEAHFGRALSGFEEPQFCGTDPATTSQRTRTATRRWSRRVALRKTTVIIFLSAQSQNPMPGTFGGGSLVLHEPLGNVEPPLMLAPAPGTLVTFPVEMTHEVLPITHGERLSIVSWYRG